MKPAPIPPHPQAWAGGTHHHPGDSHTAGRGLGANDACFILNLNGRNGEGFRMAARRELSAGAEGRRPKASQEGTRGGWADSLRSMGI